MLSKKFIISGSVLLIGLIFLNVDFVFGSVVPMSVFGLTLPISQRGFVFLIGVGLIGLRWFLGHRNHPDDDAT